MRVSVAPDGSPIALYLTLPGADEATVVHAAIPASAAILELGCGVGRVTRHLVALGHTVTGVDNSDAMLAHASHLNGVDTVLADIATLDLSPRTWPVVILASRMVNDENGSNFVAAARRHLTDSGTLLVERHEPGWIDAARSASDARHGVSFTLAGVDHTVPGILRATMIYEVKGTTYRQRIVSYEVDDERLDADSSTSTAKQPDRLRRPANPSRLQLRRARSPPTRADINIDHAHRTPERNFRHPQDESATGIDPPVSPDCPRCTPFAACLTARPVRRSDHPAHVAILAPELQR